MKLLKLVFGMHAGITAVYGCTHGDVRLASGSTTNRGRVEVCVGQTWGTVCNSGFDSNDGRVVCRQLGYDKPGASEYMNIHSATIFVEKWDYI